MKIRKYIIYVWISISMCIITAQNQVQNLDDALININQSSVDSGIIYERTMQLANLYNFNREEGFNIAYYKYFRQALLEIYNTSNYHVISS